MLSQNKLELTSIGLGSRSLLPEHEMDGLGLAASATLPAACTRSELELLFCCARTCVDPISAKRIRSLLREDMDWSYLLQTASRWRVMPLLYWNLNAICPEDVPEAILAQLGDHFLTNAQHNLFLTGELLKLLNLLERHGIPAIPLKGPVLAASIYGNLAFRCFGDLDIWVRQQDVLRARDLLISQGFQPQMQLTNGRETSFLRSHRELRLDRDDGRILVELQWRIPTHWKVLRFLPLDQRRLLERLESVPIAGGTVLSPPPEDLLLILCVHGASHGWSRLSWICDVAELIRVHPQMDYGRVMAQARASGCERMLILGLRLARDLLGAALPAETLRRMQADVAVEPLVVQVREWLLGDEGVPTHLFEEAAFYIRLRERLRERISYLFFYAWAYLRPGVIPTVKDRAAVPLPPFLSFFYYLLRPIRMVGKYGLGPLKRLLQHLPRHLLAKGQMWRKTNDTTARPK